MKLSFWDILASMVMLAGLALATIFINIFVNPYSFINPFPPPTPIATLDVPTLTPSPRALPELWTATPTLFGASDAMGTPTVTATGATATGTITGTVFVLPTNTATLTPSKTATVTKTLSKTPNKTLTSYYVKTATKTATKTEEGASGDKTPPTTPGTPYSTSLGSDPNPIFSWTPSTDSGGSGLAGYHVTWGLDSGGNNTMWRGTGTTFISPTLTIPGIYYFFVRAYDEAGNQSAWAGPARFGYTGTGSGAPSATTNTAASITETGATLRGTVSANGYSTTVTFNYGPTTAYGTTVTAIESPVTTSSVSVSYVLSGLTPATTYYYRVVATNTAGTVYGSQGSFTTSKTDQAALTINDPGTVTYGAGTVTLTTAGGSGTGAVTFTAGSSTGCTITSPGVLTVTNASGVCNIVATKAGDTTYNAVNSPTLSVTLAKASQAAITFTDPGPVPYLDTVTLAASGGSGFGLFSYDATGSTGCSISSGNVLTDTDNAGTCTVTATKAADDNYLVATASTSVTLSQADQTTLVVTDPGDVAFGATVTLATSGGSGGGAVTFDIGGSTGCSLAGADLTVTDNTGSCAVTATKAADANYLIATSASQTITMVKADQTIGAISPTTGSVLAGVATLSPATSSASLTVTFASTTPAVCTVAGTAVTYLTEGTCSITADQAGDANYNAAPQVNGTIVVGP